MPDAGAQRVSLHKRSAFIDREGETRSVQAALDRALSGEGSALLIEGTEGIGKTRLARWAEEKARTLGFEVRWGHGVRDGLVPFMPIELLFRTDHRRPRSAGASTDGPQGQGARARPPMLLVEEPRPRTFWTLVENAVGSSSVVIVTRERPASLRGARPRLADAKAILWITRLEGPENVPPGDLDILGDRLQEHLRAVPGSTVSLEGIEYLVSQGAFLPVLRLLQFLRDVAQETEGQVLLALNPASLEPREVSLFESDAEVLEEERPNASGGSPVPPASPTQTMLRLLSEVESACERTPQLIVLDDLQWADPATVRAFQFLVRNTRDRPVVWVGCLRPQPDAAQAEPGPPESTGQVLQHMEVEGALKRLELRPFDTENLRALLRSSTDVPLEWEGNEAALREFLSRTGGNPHFALSALRLLWEQGRIELQGDHAVFRLPAAPEGPGPKDSLPTTLRRAASDRLDLLPEPDRRFLSLASLLGKEFDLPPLAHRLSTDVRDLESRARRLEAAHGLLHQLIGSPGRWAFQDGTAWEAALESIPPPSRRDESLAFAEWWTKHRPDDVEGLARLYHESGDAERSLPWVRRAINRAIDQQSAEAVERYLQWLREFSPKDPASVDARALEEVRIAQELRRIGASRASLRVLRGLVPLELGTEARRERELALANLLADSELEEAWTRLARLEEELAAAPSGSVSRLVLGRVTTTRAFLSRLRGDYEGGRKAAEKALQELPTEGIEAVRARARALYEAGLCDEGLSRWEEAKNSFEAALEIGRRPEAASWILPSLAGLAILGYLTGDLRASRQRFEEAIEEGRRTGELQRVIPLLLSLADLETSLGDLRRAWELHGEAARMADRFDLAHLRTAAAALKGDLFTRERRWKDALAAYESARAAGPGRTRRSGSVQIGIGSAWAAGESGDPSSGLRDLGRVERESSPLPAEHQDFFYEVRARLHDLKGEFEEAREDLTRAEGSTGPSPHRQARIVGDLSSWELLHGDAGEAQRLRERAEALYRSAGADPVKARATNEVFPVAEGPGSPTSGTH